MSDGAKWFGNELSAFERGVQLDYRVLLAIEFLKSETFAGAGRLDKPDIDYAVDKALHMADAVMANAALRGWVKELPETGELTAATKRHIERTVRANVHGNAVGLRIQREEGSGVAVAHGGSPFAPSGVVN